MITSLIIPAFLAGLLTFVAPCTFPLIPSFLAFIGGSVYKPEKGEEHELRKKLFVNALFFVIGFSIVFIILGTIAALLGQLFGYKYHLWLTRISGIFVILFGIFLLDIYSPKFLSGTTKIKLPKFIKPGQKGSSMALGMAFALGWTPCVGPILGTILLLAATSTTALQGIILLIFYSIGLAIPYLLLTLAVGTFLKYSKKVNKYLDILAKIGGIMIIILGILLLTNNFSLVLQYGFKIFSFINYQSILNYL